MDPKIKNIDENTNTLKFTLEGINVSIANAIRRIILSDIPCIVFKTLPYNDSKITININTTLFNNEIIKQRLSCIPIHIDDLEFPIDDYILEIDEINNTNNIKYITTNDFKLKNIKQNTYISNSNLINIFPKNNLSGRYIDFIRLNPAIGDKIKGDQLKLSCKLSYGTASEDGAFNVVSTCSYGFTKDLRLINDKWNKIQDEYIETGKTKEELEIIKKDWLLLDAQRIYLEDSFDFIIETIGIYKNYKIMELACNIIIKQLNNLVSIINETPTLITETESVNENSYDIRLENYDYTIGKILEFIIYKTYLTDKEILNYCGFIKSHPHNNYSIIRIIFKNIVDNQEIQNILLNCIKLAINCYEKIKDNFIL